MGRHKGTQRWVFLLSGHGWLVEAMMPVGARMSQAKMVLNHHSPLSPNKILLLFLLSPLLQVSSSGLASGIRSRGGDDPSLRDVYANMDPVQFTGPSDWVIHDPSKIVATDGLLMIAVTGKAQEDGYMCGLETWYISAGQTDWQPGQCLFTSKPDWVAEELPANDGAYWAPTLVDGRRMYYSVSAFENDDAQCIGMATATGVAPHLTWQDAGKPVTCRCDIISAKMLPVSSLFHQYGSLLLLKAHILRRLI